jgi:hypothetical protein
MSVRFLYRVELNAQSGKNGKNGKVFMKKLKENEGKTPGEFIGDCGIATPAYCRRRRCGFHGVCGGMHPEEIKTAAEWISRRCWRRKAPNLRHSSYGLKHVFESETGAYASNGSFIRAAVGLGYKVFAADYPNCYLNIGVKTPRNRRFWARRG